MELLRAFTGNASISARRAITGPGLLPLKIPTTPVLRFRFVLRYLNCASAAIFSAVLNSRFLIQDFDESLFQEITLDSNDAAFVSILDLSAVFCADAITENNDMLVKRMIFFMN
jgi:hypothetical protein